MRAIWQSSDHSLTSAPLPFQLSPQDGWSALMPLINSKKSDQHLLSLTWQKATNCFSHWIDFSIQLETSSTVFPQLRAQVVVAVNKFIATWFLINRRLEEIPSLNLSHRGCWSFFRSFPRHVCCWRQETRQLAGNIVELFISLSPSQS